MLLRFINFVIGENKNGKLDKSSSGLNYGDFIFVIGAVFIATVLGLMFHKLNFSDVTVIAWYILAVQVVAVRISGIFVNAVVSFICVIVFNFFFTEPRYTLLAYDSDYFMTFFVMFIVSFLAGLLADQLRKMLGQAEKDKVRTQILFDTSQLLNKAENYEEIAIVTGMQLRKLHNGGICIALAEDEGKETLFFPENCKPSFSPQLEQDSLLWTFRSGKMAGNGTSVYPAALARYIPIMYNGYIYGVVGILEDDAGEDAYTEGITTAILNQCELAMENIKSVVEKEAEKLKVQNERMKANLLRGISHDLRTPLTSISGNASVLLQSGDTLDQQTRQQLEQDIYDDSEWLIGLVENLLAISRVQEGNVQVNCSDEVLDDIIDEALQHVDRHISEHTLEVKKSHEMLLVSVDAHLIVQVIINLIDNAIKYSGEGSTICVTTGKIRDEITVSVSDDGPGISKEEQPRVFEMFYNGKKKVEDSRKSMGLGLALCKSIVEAHGGQIRVESKESGGVVFSFTLPEAKGIKANEH